MAWFRNRETPPQADPERARALLAEAQSLRSRGDLANAQELARQALDEGTQAHGERHPALVPFLLVYAGLLNQLRGWSAGKPFYERAQRLRTALGRGGPSTSS
jgi:alkylhydroperoxidase family enzyme